MIQYITENGADIITILVAVMAALKVIVRLTPTLKDDDIFGKVDKVLEFIIPNYGKKKN
jgi:hypothetical protein